MGKDGVNLEKEGEGVVMDTPERKQFTSPVSKIEVFLVFMVKIEFLWDLVCGVVKLCLI